MRYILNSAVITGPGLFAYRLLTQQEARDWLEIGPATSCIGYEETCLAFERVFHQRLLLNRQTITLAAGDEALVFRLTSRVADPRQKGAVSIDTILAHLEVGLLSRVVPVRTPGLNDQG